MRRRWEVRRVLLVVSLLVAILVVAAGAGLVPSGKASTWSISNPCTSDATADGETARNASGGRSKLTTATAKAWAYCAEERYLTRRLRRAGCVESWGLTTYGGVDPSTRVHNRTADGIYVRVTHPYWWGNDEITSDSASTATYLVTPEESTRVSGRTVAPCGGGLL